MCKVLKGELPKSYSPSSIENEVYAYWEQEGYFAAKDASDAEPFCIVLPPPNVTGALHIGHALTATVQDLLIRWRRMQGRNALWLPGTDHAGIATQMVVERQLKNEGLDRRKIGREKFLERVWKWKEQYGGRIQEQHRKLGASLDWDRERFTMDEGLSRAVREAFVRLYEKGLITRDNRLINWCVSCTTALSDVEVDRDKPELAEMWSFAYEVEGGGEITVATTRPETMLGDTAVAVHPDDERYKHLIGKRVKHPFQNRTFPIVGDPILADPSLGTGAVKVTPAHDPNDFECGKRNNLEFIEIFDNKGIVNENGAPFAGMDRFEARAKVKEAIDAKGLFRGRRDHEYAPGRCLRCRSVVEPKLSLQWFVDTSEMAEKALHAVKSGKTLFVPKQQEHRFFDWLEKKLPWCISRQLWWGHRIPAWYCDDCNAVTVLREDPTECSKCKSKNVRQDEDVLDTWFSSALWPFSTLGWPDNTDSLKTFYPTSVLETGYDIVTFWVSRMMMMGLELMGDIPFRHVLLHPMVRDQDGNKMSKSRGNVIDPLDVVSGIGLQELIAKTQSYTLPKDEIERAVAYQKEHYPEGFPECGADALRFTLAAYTGQDQDIRFAVSRVDANRKFGNKIWQAVLGFAMPHIKDIETDIGVPQPLTLADRWILARLAEVAEQANKGLEEFSVGDVTHLLYHFFWDELCSWYIELLKPVLNGDDPHKAQTGKRVLCHVLEVSLRLLHPLMPFLTEALWQELPKSKDAPKSIMITRYPTASDGLPDTEAKLQAERLMSLVSAVRTVRAEYDIAPSMRIPVYLYTDNDALKEIVLSNEELIKSLARIDALNIETMSSDRAKGSAAAIIDGAEIAVPLKGVVDLSAEAARLNKEKDKLTKLAVSVEKKLESEVFLSRAPQDIIEKEKDKLREATERLSKINDALLRIEELEKA